MKMMSPEEYENQISLLIEALKFYENKENYVEKTLVSDKWSTKLELDFGAQARFALKKVQETLDLKKKLREDYKKVMDETISAIENHPFDLLNAITKIKNENKI